MGKQQITFFTQNLSSFSYITIDAMLKIIRRNKFHSKLTEVMERVQ